MENDPLDVFDSKFEPELAHRPRDGGARAELVGSTTQVPISEVFKTICQMELSGDLQIVSGRSMRTLYFDRGFIVFAGSNLKKDRLGQRFIDSGHVSQEEIDAAFRRSGGRKRIGEVLIQEGVLTEEGLGREVARQAKRIALTTYVLDNAIYSFDERKCAIPMDLRLGLSVYRIQLEGIRYMSNGQLIHKVLGSFDRAVQVGKVPPFSFKESELRPVERKVLERAAETSRLRRIMEVVGEEEEDVMRAAYGLLCANILEYADTKPGERKVQVETESFLLSSLERTRVAAPTNVRQEVLLLFDGLESASAGELLDVDEEADEEEIERAYEKQQKEWKKKQVLVADEKSLFVKVEEIRRRLAEAHERMQESKKTEESTEERSSTAHNEVEDSIEEEFEIPFEDETDIPENAREDTLDEMDISIEDEDLLMAEGAESQLENDSRALDEEEMMADSPSETDSLDYDFDEAQSDAIIEDPTPVEYEESIASSSQSSNNTEEIAGRVGKLLYDIKVRNAVNDKEGAISLMYEVVELMPQSAKYEARLAEALASHPVLSKKAERHFRRALSLDPQSADLHFRLGRYYKNYKMRSRAIAEFKTTLRIDPGHSKARSALVEIKGSSDRPIGQLFKKIFG